MTTIEKAKSISDVSQRSIFPTVDSAMEYIGKLVELMGEDQLPLHMYGYGMDDEGEVTAKEGEEWPEGFNAAVILLQSQQEVDDGEGGLKKRQIPHTILLRPFPTVEQLLADTAGEKMIRSVLEKELNHRAVRPLRTADNLAAVLGEVPASIAAFCSSGRESGGAILGAYNELYAQVHDYVKGKIDRVSRARLIKAEMKKCLENTSYANHYYTALEEANDFKTLLSCFIALGLKKGVDVTIFESWAATRDEQSFDGASDDEEGLTTEDLLDGLIDLSDQV